MLLNEDLDYRLAHSFPTGFDVYSTQRMEWSSAAEEIARAIFPAAKPPDPSKPFQSHVELLENDDRGFRSWQLFWITP